MGNFTISQIHEKLIIKLFAGSKIFALFFFESWLTSVVNKNMKRTNRISFLFGKCGGKSLFYFCNNFRAHLSHHNLIIQKKSCVCSQNGEGDEVLLSTLLWGESVVCVPIGLVTNPIPIEVGCEKNRTEDSVGCYRDQTVEQ
jgi:hypothetical protein